MFQGGAGDADRDATIQACVSSVETQCQYTANEDNEVRMPSQCQGQDGEIYPEVSDFESTTDGMIDCDSV